jgi:hypothetical protein
VREEQCGPRSGAHDGAEYEEGAEGNQACWPTMHEEKPEIGVPLPNESRLSCSAALAGAPCTQPSPQTRWRTT